MSNIRLERFPIQVPLWGPITWGHLGGDHLQIVFQQDPFDNGEGQHRWWVIEGTRTAPSPGIPYETIGAYGASGLATIADSYGIQDPKELADLIGTPSKRGSVILPFDNAFNAWFLMKEKGIDLNDQFFPYIAVSLPLAPLPVANSSSMVASLLYYAGVDIAQNMPFQFLTFTTGHHTLLGTSGDDELSIQWSFDTLLGGEGNDTLIGGESGIAIEKFYGGEGDDTFKWSPGRNFLHGGQPFMPYEDDGLDTVDYSGAGVIRIERTAVPKEHLIATFVVTHSFGIDYLYSIERVAHSQLNDTLIIGEGVVYTPTRTRVELDLGDEEEGKREDGNEGDVIDLKGKPKALLIAPSDDSKVIRVAEAVAGSQDFPTDHGIWVRSAETLIATDLAGC